MPESALRRGPPLPLAARLYIRSVIAVGFATVAIAAATLPRGLDTVPLAHEVIGAFLILAGGFFLQTRSPTLAWKGQRIAVSPDEALLLVGFYALPPGVVILSALAASFCAQAYLRKAPIKMVFNSSVHVSAIGLGALAFAGGLAVGLGPLSAVLLVPFVVSAANQFVVAGLLSVLEDSNAPLATLLSPSLFTSIALTSVTGVTLGFIAIVLLGYSPLALVLLLPIGYMFFEALSAGYRHENELTARQVLSHVAERLVGESNEDAIVEAAHAASREVFALREMHVHLAVPGVEPREWHIVAGGEDKTKTIAFSAPLLNKTGGSIGEVRFVVVKSARAQSRDDRELAATIAGALSIAFGTSAALRSLEAAQRRLRSVLNAARDPVLLVSAEGALVYCNTVAAGLFREAEPSESTSSLAYLFAPESYALLTERLKLPDPSGVLEVETRGSLAERRALEVSISPITLEEKPGARPMLLLFGRDVTERRRLERQAAENRETMSRTERLSALGTLVAGVAHEINNPLMYMRGNIELALADLAALNEAYAASGGASPVDLSEARAGLEASLSGVDRIERITKSLKVVARKGSTDRRVVDVGVTLASVEELVKVAVPPNVNLLLATPNERLPIWASASELHQVFLNLVKNAIDAIGRNPGTVSVSARADRESVEVVVLDDGPGIPPDVRARMFTPFFTTKSEGTGLGLSIVHTIVKDHGGTLTVESEPGKGARFVVRLPLLLGPPPETAKLPPVPAQAISKHGQ
ncbi:MAG: ATP-binding protein [Thermoplasmatota archaeon]